MFKNDRGGSGLDNPKSTQSLVVPEALGWDLFDLNASMLI